MITFYIDAPKRINVDQYLKDPENAGKIVLVNVDDSLLYGECIEGDEWLKLGYLQDQLIEATGKQFGLLSIPQSKIVINSFNKRQEL